MKRTHKDIKRHAAIMTGIIAAIDGELDSHDLSNEERAFLVRELTITGLANIGASKGTLAFDKVIDEAANRAIELCQSVKDDDSLITNGMINPRLH